MAGALYVSGVRRIGGGSGCEPIVDNSTGYVGQAEVATLMAMSQSKVIDAK